MSHLKYCNVLIKVSTKHRLSIVPGQSISLFWADSILGIVLVLPDVFIVSYEIAKRVMEITRGRVMGRYFND